MTREQETKFIGGSMIFLCIVIGVSIFCFGLIVGFHEAGGKVKPMKKDKLQLILDTSKQEIGEYQ